MVLLKKTLNPKSEENIMEIKHLKHSQKRSPKKTLNDIRKMDVNTVAQALIQNHGLLTQTANFLNVTRLSLQKFLNEQKELSFINELSNEVNLDLAEYELLQKVKEGQLSAIKYYLDKKGQSRGYQPKPENTTNIQNGIVILPSTQNPNEWEQSAKKYQLKQQEQLKQIPNQNDN